MSTDNPAGRLHAILKAIREDYPPTRASWEVWAEVTGVDLESENKLAWLLDALGEVAALPGQIEHRISAISDVRADLYLRWLGDVEKALDGLYWLGNPIESVQRQYGDATLLNLEFCSEALIGSSLHSPAQHDLASLADELHELSEDIHNFSLPEDLTNFLLDHVEDMQRAIRLVRVNGADGLQSSLERAIGASYFLVQEHPEVNAEKPGVVTRYFGLIIRLGQLLSGANAGWQLEEHVRKALGN